jgi:hypothetical protein
MPNIAGGGAAGGAPAGDGAGGCCAAISQTAMSIIEAVKHGFLCKFIVVLV